MGTSLGALPASVEEAALQAVATFEKLRALDAPAPSSKAKRHKNPRGSDQRGGKAKRRKEPKDQVVADKKTRKNGSSSRSSRCSSGRRSSRSSRTSGSGSRSPQLQPSRRHGDKKKAEQRRA